MLDGKTCFITGGAQGIGLAVAERLAGLGARVAVADLDEKALAAAMDLLADRGDVRGYVVDVVDREGVAAVADRVEEDLGPVHGLFNVAGVIDSVSPSRMRGAVWDWVIGVNLNGVYNCLQAFLPRMIERRQGGLIVNTSSVAGMIGVGSGFAYTAAKFGVVGLTEALRHEVGHHGISVSVVCPGQVATRIVTNTENARPADAEPRTDRVASILQTAQSRLTEQGIPTAEAARVIVDGALAGLPYIFTDNHYGPFLQQRTDAILESMAACFPDAAEPVARAAVS